MRKLERPLGGSSIIAPLLPPAPSLGIVNKFKASIVGHTSLVASLFLRKHHSTTTVVQKCVPWCGVGRLAVHSEREWCATGRGRGAGQGATECIT